MIRFKSNRLQQKNQGQNKDGKQNNWVTFRLSFNVLIVFLLMTCSQTENNNHTEGIRITIHTNDKKQIIRNFGASDAWTTQFVGQWPDDKKNQIADWLFSTAQDADGRPKGIGLSLWRFNIGAGSAAQDNITDEWRRSEGFLQDDLSYDWSKQAGQRWFMTAAKLRGVEEFVGFSNSPPVQITKNGKGFSSNGSEANLPPENYLAFAQFLIDVAKHFNAEDMPFSYLSPFNEPQWDWTGDGQEGSPYKNSDIFAITKKLDSLITVEDLDIKLQIAEAGKLNYLYEHADKTQRGDQVNVFYNAQSPFYIGSFSNVDKIISGHSYFTSALPDLLEVRENVLRSVAQASLPIEFWQTEYCMLGGQEEIKPEGKDTGIDPALYVARVIHFDLTLANASAWHWWLAVSAYDYKDGLIYVDKNKNDGTVEDTKLLWALGNFSRFIRPGSQRLALSATGLNTNDPKGLMISSYVNAENNKITSVVINYSYYDSTVIINTEDDAIQHWKPYITGKGLDEKLKPLPIVNAREPVTIPARSVVTLIDEK
ncbi:MAG TPA: glycoside hydrolase [Ohtaekwangia sp.]|nr:glycoside hydrolase [Ohtaekwangia sp.]